MFEDLGIVIPAFRARNQLPNVVQDLIKLGIKNIVVVDDCCPESSGNTVDHLDCKVITNKYNLGVGGAFMVGLEYFENQKDQKKIKYIGKIDADLQHDPKAFFHFINIIRKHNADYCKGNRYLLNKKPMGQSLLRYIGNAGLSFLTKFSTGYWSIDDPLHGQFVADIDLLIEFKNKGLLDKRYIFETSILAACSDYRAKVYDIPSEIKYSSEVSSLSIRLEFFRFGCYHLKKIISRVFRFYIFPKFDILGIIFIYGFFSFCFSLFYGAYLFIHGLTNTSFSEPGQIGIFLVFFVTGLQSIFFFIQTEKFEEHNRYPISQFLK